MGGLGCRVFWGRGGSAAGWKRLLRDIDGHKVGSQSEKKRGSSCHLLEAKHLLIHLCFCAAVKVAFSVSVSASVYDKELWHLFLALSFLLLLLLLKLKVRRHQKRFTESVLESRVKQQLFQ